MQILKVCADRRPASWPRVITNRHLDNVFYLYLLSFWRISGLFGAKM